jgi:HD-GYP domain-containing protein (c-di-GMP phosphodiesterase class II)
MKPGRLSIAQAHQDIALNWYKDIIAHSYRLVRPAREIARALGMSPHEVDRVGLAALLHDVGKLVLPKAILCKPAPLTEEEWAVMYRHPEIGHQMLLLAGEDWADLGPIVAAHHEHWDGGGYPAGLEKDTIPLEARILSVVDAYDAMTSRRIYRHPLPHEEARAELKQCSGNQFDPIIVAAFIQLLDAGNGFGYMHIPPERKQRMDGGPVNLSAIHYLVTLATAAFALKTRELKPCRKQNTICKAKPIV